MPSVRRLKDRWQNLLVDAYDLPHQIPAPAGFAARMVGPSAVLVLGGGTDPVWQLHHQIVYPRVDIVSVDRSGPGADGRETGFQGPEHHSVAVRCGSG